MQDDGIKYVAELSHVREVTLLGTADLVYWRDRLDREKLTPAEADGKAQIMIIAASSKFKGVRFREVSFSVLVSDKSANGNHNAAFLLKAFNSCRFFAFCERTFFSTPYQHANASVSAELPASIQLVQNEQTIFEASMKLSGGAARLPSRDGEEGWTGPVYLPRGHRDSTNSGKLFFARLHGQTQTFPFQASADTLAITPATDEVLSTLIDSGFTPSEWVIRTDASHSKSKTRPRDH
jgi:hypothetical protein